jgi:hypothetical protein
VCASCGAIQLNGRCERCGGAESVAALPPVQATHWVQIRLSVKCLTCQRSSPVNRLALDGRFYCVGCSREMFFDGDIWKEKITSFASGLGDAFWSLVGVFPAWPQQLPSSDYLEEHDSEIEEKLQIDDTVLIEHLFKKCLDIGRGTSGLTMEKEGGMVISAGGMKTGAFALEMSPGHPLCPKCKTPLGLHVVGDGLVTASCARCGTQENYRAPQGATAIGICGVVAPEHVDGREVARVAAQPGSAAVAVACPKCGSALQLAPGARITNCQYCHTTSVVPDHVIAAGSPTAARPEPLWLAFQAPSAARTVIVEALSGQSASDARRVHEQADEEERERQSEAERRREAEQASRQRTMSAVFTVGVIVAAAGAVLAFQLTRPSKKSDIGRAATTASAASTKAPKPVRSDPVPIGSCKCSFGDGQSTPEVTLTLEAPPSDGAVPWSLDIERKSGFMSEGSTVRFKPTLGALLPPAADTPAPTRMGIACDTGIFVLVADKAATGWSSINGAWKWNATLPSASTDAPDGGLATLTGSDYAGGCVPLATKGGSASLRLANGKHVSLSLKDGKIH